HPGISNPTYAEVSRSTMRDQLSHNQGAGVDERSQGLEKNVPLGTDTEVGNRFGAYMASNETMISRRNSSPNRLGAVIRNRIQQSFVRGNHNLIDERNDDLNNYIRDDVRARDDVGDNDNDDDFTGCIRKRALRFYIGGFNSCISRNKIYNYVNKRGVTATFVRIWQSKRAYDSTVIRLNVTDNANATRLLDRNFWPAGVVCHPWKNRAERYGADRTMRSYSSKRGYGSSSGRPTYGRSDLDDYNPYSPLRDIANLDIDP
ncbi:MAG: hypothetical protein KZQ77_11830, partial [Candidatus Thiodiazotropha sp. (ex Notomyrtea botanica)]|nr:hypothetical protein [Candidatus Thiodiazotropha sp. (ex Notomyrtea botanica)]